MTYPTGQPWRLLFVCTANYCRSPLAEGLARKRLAALPWGRDVEVDSAATHAYRVGEPPDPAVRELALREGVDLSAKRARVVEPADFERFELIVTMERSHIDHLRGFCPTARRGRLKRLMEFVAQAEDPDVPDPFGGDEQDFEYAYTLIDRGIEGLFKSIGPLVALQRLR